MVGDHKGHVPGSAGRYRLAAFTVVLAVSLTAIAGTAAGLDARLGFLEPLFEGEWVGGYVGEEVPDVEIRLTFVPVLDGAKVSYHRRAEDLDFQAITHFFSDGQAGEVRFMSMNNRGTFEDGTVSTGDGRIVLDGTTHFPGGTRRFRTTLVLGQDGVLTDTFERMVGDEWVVGHVQEYTRPAGPAGAGLQGKEEGDR